MNKISMKYYSVIAKAIGKPISGLSFLDLCCGEMSMTRLMKFKWSLHVDIQDFPLRPGSFPFIKSDVFDALRAISDGHFDVCFCSDGIEHFRKTDGLRLLSEMERVSKLQIIFTPLGDMWLHPESTDPHAHKTGWMPDELNNLGWTTKVFPRWHEKWNFGAFFAWKGKI